MLLKNLIRQQLKVTEHFQELTEYKWIGKVKKIIKKKIKKDLNRNQFIYKI